MDYAPRPPIITGTICSGPALSLGLRAELWLCRPG